MGINRTEVKVKSRQGYEISCLDGRFAGQEAVIICLHGFAGDKRSSVIERLAMELVQNGLGTYTFDWPAHGESTASFADLTIENCLKDLEKVEAHVKRHYKGSVYCFATSFGGYLAILYHQRHPEAFEKIFLRSPALRMAKVMTGFMNEKQLAAFLDGSILNFGFEQPLLLARNFYDDVKDHDAFEAPPHPERITVIHGDQDDVVPLADSVEYADRYGVGLHILKGADHRYKHPGDVEQVIEKARVFFAKTEIKNR